MGQRTELDKEIQKLDEILQEPDLLDQAIEENSQKDAVKTDLVTEDTTIDTTMQRIEAILAEEEAQEAATKIQARFRGHKLRKPVSEAEESVVSSELLDLANQTLAMLNPEETEEKEQTEQTEQNIQETLVNQDQTLVGPKHISPDILKLSNQLLAMLEPEKIEVNQEEKSEQQTVEVKQSVVKGAEEEKNDNKRFDQEISPYLVHNLAKNLVNEALEEMGGKKSKEYLRLFKHEGLTALKMKDGQRDQIFYDHLIEVTKSKIMIILDLSKRNMTLSEDEKKQMKEQEISETANASAAQVSKTWQGKIKIGLDSQKNKQARLKKVGLVIGNRIDKALGIKMEDNIPSH